MSGPPASRWPADRRERIWFAAALLAFIAAGAAFPRAAYLARWPSRLGPRGLVVYVAWLTALNFWIRQFALPWMRARAEEAEAAKGDLRARLGREPTDDELVEALVEARGGDLRRGREIRLPFAGPVRWWPLRERATGGPTGP